MAGHKMIRNAYQIAGSLAERRSEFQGDGSISGKAA
jgi:hypothetical protein